MTRPTDDIVDEIHAIRQQHAARFDFDVDRIVDDLRASQERRAAEGWVLLKAPNILPIAPGSAVRRARFGRR